MDWEDDTGGPLNSEDFAGLTIMEEEDLLNGDEDDAATLWLAAHKGPRPGQASSAMPNALAEAGMAFEGSVYGNESAQVTGMTAADLQLVRFGHMEPRVQRGIQSALYGTLDASKIGKGSLEIMAAVEAFTSVTGVDASTFAGRMRIDGSVGDPRSKQDLGMVISMLQNTAGEHLVRGPGKNLPGNYLNSDKMISKTAKLGLAFDKLGGLADLYIPEATKQSSIYGQRKEQVVNQLTDRMMNQKFFNRGKDTSAFADFPTLPLPNELNIPGLVPTRSSVYGSTSPHTRMEQSAFLASENIDQYSEYEIKQMSPSLINSLIPITRGDRERVDGKNRTKPNIARGQEHQMGQAIQDAEFVRKALLEAFPTMQNESEGVGRAIGFNSPYAEQEDAINARDMAAILDVDIHQYAGEESLSAQREFVAAELESGATELALYGKLPPMIPESSARARYRSSVASNPSPIQGTEAWLEQRKGNITASTADVLLSNSGAEKMAATLARERLGLADLYIPNAYTKGGNDWEDRVRKSFLSGPGRDLGYEETFFETNPDLKGFGVSPDGRLYNEDGSSAGLLELKYLTPKSMGGAVKKYTPQMQMQMAITGESQTHFYAYDHSTGEYIHEVVQADEELQGKLLSAGKEAQAMATNLDARGVVALEKQIKEARKPRQRRGSSQGRAGTEAKFKGRSPDEPQTGFVSGGGGGVGAGENSSRGGVGGYSGGQLTVQGRDLALVPDADFREAELGAIEETTNSLKELSKSAKDAGGMLGEMMGFALAGTSSGIGEVQNAAAIGMETNQSRGMRDALMANNVSEAGAQRVMDASSNMMMQMNDPRTYDRAFGNIHGFFSSSTVPEIRNQMRNLPSPSQFASMSPRQIAGMFNSMTSGMSAEGRATTLAQFNMQDMASFTGTTDDLLNRVGSLDQEGLEGADRSVKMLQRGKRDVQEHTGSFGESGGFISQAGQYIGDFFSSKTGAAVTAAAAYGTAKVGGIGAASTLAAGGLTTAASAAPYAAMPLAVVGGVAYGMTDKYAGERQETIDAIGAGTYSQQQAGIGIDFSHLWKMISGDNSPEQVAGAIPSQSVGSVRDPSGTGQEVKVESTVNIEVNVSQDLVETIVDDNGTITEEGTGYSR